MEYPKQYLLNTSETSPFGHWRSRQFGSWWLHHSPDIPLVRIEDTSGNEIGLLFGWIIFRGRLMQNGDTLISNNQCEGVANEYDDLGGRFNYLYHFHDEVGLLTDAGGLLSPVYDTKYHIVASTPTMLKQVVPLQQDGGMRAAFSAGKPEIWYPFGVTPFVGVHRLLPNHSLSLTTWQTQRLFPSSPEVLAYNAKRCNVMQVVMDIAECIKANVSALIEAGNNLVHLTAGRDTRMILAACRQHLDKCQFQTVAVDCPQARLDCHVASELGKRFELRYRQLPVMKPSLQELDEWQQRTGDCVYDTVAQLCATAKHYGRYTHEIMGTGGEAARGCYWYPGDDRKESISALELLERFEIVPGEITLQLAQSWLDGLQGYRVGDILDLAYVELRLGCWAGASVYGHPVSFPSLSPFNSHFIYQRLLSLPLAYRINRQFVRDYLNLLWPELQSLPFNRALGLTKLKYLGAELRPLIPQEMRERIKQFSWKFRGTQEPSSAESKRIAEEADA